MNPATLLKVLRASAPVADQRQAIPILNHVLIESNGHLRLTTTDLEIGIRVTLSPQLGEPEFQVTAPAKLVRSILQTATDDVTFSAMCDIYRRDHVPSLIIRDATAEWQIYGMNSHDFPMWPDVLSWSLDSINTAECVKALKDAIKHSPKMGRHWLRDTTVRVQPLGELRAATAERLAAVLSKLAKTYPTMESTVEEKYVCLTLENTEIIVRLTTS